MERRGRNVQDDSIESAGDPPISASATMSRESRDPTRKRRRSAGTYIWLLGKDSEIKGWPNSVLCKIKFFQSFSFA